MKILLINKFFYKRGGAETVFFDTAELLESNGHQISFFSMHHPDNFPSDYDSLFISNVDYENSGPRSVMKSAGRLLYSFEAIRNVKALIRREQPDIVHMHNIYHQISPSILSEIKKAGIPVLMTLHDYKLVCGSHNLMTKSKICESCQDGRYFNCLIKKCVKRSYLKSLLTVIEMYLHHRVLHLYDLVDCYISPSRFLKDKVGDMGFTGEIKWIPNFIRLQDFAPRYDWEGKEVVYFGRLSEVKGLVTLVNAAAEMDINLKVIGDGPVRQELQTIVYEKNIQNVFFLGFKSGEELRDEIRKSMAVIVPSEWYENNPMSVIEAFALGKPVIGARIGGIPELVIDYETGITFESGSTSDLKDKINWLVAHPEEISRMGRNARKMAEQEFTSETHYERLMRLYNSVLKK